MTTLLTEEFVTTAYDRHTTFKDTIANKKKYFISEYGETCYSDMADRIFNETVKERIWDKKDNVAMIDMLQGKRFLPAGSILCGLNNPKGKSSLSNCYLTKIENDSIEAIFQALSNLAKTYSYRGGSGIDITVLRPAETPVNNAAVTSSGAVSFMPLIETTTKTIGQEGRRGAAIITLDIRHPDALKFIWCKVKPEEIFKVDELTGETPSISFANISLKVVDAFMQAVVDDENWNFIFPSFTKLQGDMTINLEQNTCTVDIHPKVREVIYQAMLQQKLYIKFDGIATHFPFELNEHSLTMFDVCDITDITTFSIYTCNVNTFTPIRDVYNTLWDGDYDKWQDDYGLPIEVYDIVKARDVYEQICSATHQIGDPGIIFISTVQRLTPGTAIDSERLKPFGVNPCGEQPLFPNGNCLLGTLVLHKYVDNPYTTVALFDVDRFLADVRLGILLLNACHEININKHPLQRQCDTDAYSKRVGVEITGMGDMLAMLNLKYGSETACDFLADIMQLKAQTEIKASLELAITLGCAPAFDDIAARQRFIDCEYIQGLKLTSELKAGIIKNGLRNTAFNTVGPCGSISMIIDNCTSGIEPLYKFHYTVGTRIGIGVTEVVHGPALEWLHDNKLLDVMAIESTTVTMLKDKLNYVEAHDLNYRQRIETQSILQRYCDTSISSTLNLSNDTTKDTIEDIYMLAWKKQLKGITVFRDGCKEGVYGSVDTCDESKKISIVSEHIPVERKLLDIEDAQRFRVNWHNGKVYIIVSLDNGNPVEIFAKIPRECGVGKDGNYNERLFHENQSLVDALSRNISLSLRYQLPLELVVKQLDKSSHAMVDMPGIFARILRRYLGNKTNGKDYKTSNCLVGQVCPECGEMSYVYEGGCPVCKSCSYTKCG